MKYSLLRYIIIYIINLLNYLLQKVDFIISDDYIGPADQSSQSEESSDEQTDKSTDNEKSEPSAESELDKVEYLSYDFVNKMVFITDLYGSHYTLMLFVIGFLLVFFNVLLSVIFRHVRNGVC